MTKPEPSDDTLRSACGRPPLLVEEVVEELLERRALRHLRQRHALRPLDRLAGRDVDHRVDQLLGHRRDGLRSALRHRGGLAPMHGRSQQHDRRQPSGGARPSDTDRAQHRRANSVSHRCQRRQADAGGRSSNGVAASSCQLTSLSVAPQPRYQPHQTATRPRPPSHQPMRNVCSAASLAAAASSRIAARRRHRPDQALDDQDQTCGDDQVVHLTTCHCFWAGASPAGLLK